MGLRLLRGRACSGGGEESVVSRRFVGQRSSLQSDHDSLAVSGRPPRVRWGVTGPILNIGKSPKIFPRRARQRV
jgi:hypothetical protein